MREHGLSFRESHGLTAKLVRHLYNLGGDGREELTNEALSDMALQVLGRPRDLSYEQLMKALDPRNFVDIRGITGGPAPQEMTRMLEAREQRQRSTLPLEEHLKTARERLITDAEALLNNPE